MFLGHPIKGRGFAEVDEAIDILVHHPATATHLSRQIATYFVSDNPPDALVQKMAQTFKSSDGDIAAVLATMVHAPEFTASLKPGVKFKDPCTMCSRPFASPMTTRWSSIPSRSRTG